MPEKFITIPKLAEMHGVTRGAVWNWIKEGKLPPRRKLSSRTVGWFESEINEFQKNFETVEETEAV